MATKVLVNGKFQTRPGVYSSIKSGIKNPSVSASSGNILIVDDGIGAGFGGGSGINGTFKNGSESVYEFNSPEDFKAFVKGGQLYNLATPLFKPTRGFAGVSKVFLVQARATTPAEIANTLTNGNFTIQPLDEGVNANGALDGSNNLSLGYAGSLVRTNIPNNTATFLTTTAQAQTVSLPKINHVAALNINVGDVFTIVAAGVTKTVTASSTLPADLYNTFVTLLNANATIAAALTATATSGYIVLTGTAVNVSFTQTSSVVAAPAQFVYQIYHGGYKGLDATNNVPFDNILSPDSVPQLVIQSPVVTAVSDLITWFQTNTDFLNGFKLKAGSTATGNIVVGDLATYPGYILAAGGTENYGANDFDSSLSVINNLDFTHILAMQYGTDATGVNNTKLFDFVTDTSKYDRLLVVAAGYDRSSFAISGTGASVTTAAYYNSDKVIVVHGGVKKATRQGFNIYSQLYKAAIILGRCAGLPSQVPVTLKSIAIEGEIHILSDKEQEFAIANGILYSYYDTEFKKFVVGLDIDSLLNNDFLVNDDGSTYSWQLKRIEAELNKGIVVAGKLRFFGDNAGGNRNTTSPEEVVVWAKGYLSDRTAGDKKDGLIIEFSNVAASIDQDNIDLTYDFVGNTEIAKLISTGTLIAGK